MRPKGRARGPGKTGQPARAWNRQNAENRQPKIFLKDGTISVKVPDNLAKLLDAYNKERVIFGLRPQFFNVEDTLAGDREDAIHASVNGFEATNYRGIIIAKAGDREFTILSETYEKIDEGSTISVQPNTNQLMLFDPDTGVNLSKTE